MPAGSWAGIHVALFPGQNEMAEPPTPDAGPGSRAEVFAFAPVFNEEGSIQLVIREWVETLRQLGVPWTFLALDDGSTDATPLLLSELTKEFPQLQVIRQRNQGHGPTCTNGYHRALASGAKWILQIDSDG